MSEVEKLQKRLDDMGVTNFNVFPGSKSSTTEELAAEVNKALDAIERGESEIIEDLDYGIETVNVSELTK